MMPWEFGVTLYVDPHAKIIQKTYFSDFKYKNNIYIYVNFKYKKI